VVLGGNEGELAVSKGLDVNAKVIERVVEVAYPDEGFKAYTVRALGSGVQELWWCGGLFHAQIQRLETGGEV